jgi:hypothetical protein
MTTVGITIWFVTIKQASALNIALLIFAIFLKSLSSTDLCPRFIRQSIILPYALKALPSFINMAGVDSKGWLVW